MELTLTVTLIMAGLTLGHWNPLVSVCPGEGKAGGEFYNIYQNYHLTHGQLGALLPVTCN